MYVLPAKPVTGLGNTSDNDGAPPTADIIALPMDLKEVGQDEVRSGQYGLDITHFYGEVRAGEFPAEAGVEDLPDRQDLTAIGGDHGEACHMQFAELVEYGPVAGGAQPTGLQLSVAVAGLVLLPRSTRDSSGH